MCGHEISFCCGSEDLSFSQQKHIIAVNDGASRFVYNRMTANDRELHSLKKAAGLCPAYKGRIEYLEQVRSSKKELVNTIPFLNGKDVDSWPWTTP